MSEINIDTRIEIREYIADYKQLVEKQNKVIPFASRSYRILKDILRQIEENEEDTFNK